MARVKEIKILSMQEAMDNLAAIVAIDLEHPPQMGIVQRHRLVTHAEEVGPHEIVWLSAEGSEGVLEILDSTFYTIHRHLVNLMESPEVNWDDPKIQKGVEGMVALSAEAASKMNRYLAFRLDKELTTKVEERAAYQELYFFYHNRFLKKLKKSADEIWTQDWASNEEATLLDVSKTGLKDFETIKQDLEYELFLICNEEGKPYFNAALIRNIKAACFDIGNEVSFEEDPLLRIRAMQDRDLQASAGQITNACQDQIADFYKMYKRLRGFSLARSLSMSLMALFLAANPRNLIQNSAQKSSQEYFHDFQIYLREAMRSDEYQKYIAYPPGSEDKSAEILLNLVHSLCKAFYTRLGGVRMEAIGLLHRSMRKGEERNRKIAIRGETIWNQFLIDDEKFRCHLAQFPNGPLFKILDLIREENAELKAFDPLFQQNFPEKLFYLETASTLVQVIRSPCPVRQSLIHKATIAEEFKGFLRDYAAVKPHKKHLMINLQDRTAWQEYTRTLAIETLQKRAEFSEELVVVTLAKNSDFYHQIGDYMNSNEAKDFLSQLKGQMISPEECGFFFPEKLSGKKWSQFIQEASALVHTLFFDSAKTLSRKNRQDFLEIFYQLLILRCIEETAPDSLSFTCKDAIDTGAAASALFFGFLKILEGEMAKELEFFRWLLYTPALFIRERPIEFDRLSRAISALERIDSAAQEKNGKLKQALEALYNPRFLKRLRVKI